MADHSHCDSCFSWVDCEDTECSLTVCPARCGMYLHPCKVEEHLRYTCWNATVPCPNAFSGCDERLPRGKIAQHLEHCPGHVILCRFSYGRSAAPFSKYKNYSHSVPHYLCETTEGEENEVLLDEKCFNGDVAISQGALVTKCSTNDGGDEAHVQKFHDLSIQYDGSGFVTSAKPSTTPGSGSICSDYSLSPRTRHCMDRVFTDYDLYSKPQGIKRMCCFSCNEIVRRDQFFVHWRDYHLNVQIDMFRVIERCPARMYGCNHGEVRMAPNPRGAILTYDPEADCIGLKLPSYVSEEKSYDYSQLPVEILMKICYSLDSLSLWNFSQVNHYIRDVCYNLVKKRGIVYSKWYKNKATNKWEQGQKVCL